MVWKEPGSAGSVGVGFNVGMKVLVGTVSAVGLVTARVVGVSTGNNIEIGDTRKQADNETSARSKVPRKPARTMLIPVGR